MSLPALWNDEETQQPQNKQACQSHLRDMHKNTFAFSIISQQRDHNGSWHLSPQTCLSGIFKIMAADDLVTQGSRASAAMVLTWFSQSPSSRRVNQGLCLGSLSWLLMTWQRKDPGHQQPWYWPGFTKAPAPEVSWLLMTWQRNDPGHQQPRYRWFSQRHSTKRVNQVYTWVAYQFVSIVLSNGSVPNRWLRWLVNNFTNGYSWYQRATSGQGVNKEQFVNVSAHFFFSKIISKVDYINGLRQERCNSIANALEFYLSCTNPLTLT